MPEVANGLDFTKGPYYASVGDFGAVASTHVHLADDIPNQASLAAGTLGVYNGFLGGTAHFTDADRLLGAVYLGHVDGPFTHSDNFRKIAGTLRYSHGTDADGYSLTAMYYHGLGNLTTDQPLRAIQEGLIDRYGTLDPSDGSRSERLSLSAHYGVTGDQWAFTASAYVIHSRMTLWNDFTHFLDDPINGDQEEQTEDRTTAGGQAAFKYRMRFGSIESDTTLGVQGPLRRRLCRSPPHQGSRGAGLLRASAGRRSGYPDAGHRPRLQRRPGAPRRRWTVCREHHPLDAVAAHHPRRAGGSLSGRRPQLHHRLHRLAKPDPVSAQGQPGAWAPGGRRKSISAPGAASIPTTCAAYSAPCRSRASR